MNARPMPTCSISLQRILRVLAAVLIVKVTAAVVWGYRDYFPANFTSDFLRGREAYFFATYRWMFYAHIVSGPVALLAGLALTNDRFHRWRPAWHRYLGRFHMANILLLVAPSGLGMAFYAMSGALAGGGFAALAIATAACTVFGWRAAVKRHFSAHRQWMMRSFVLLCSAVTLRLVSGLATILELQSEWFDPIAAWACWVVPLMIYEGTLLGHRWRSLPAMNRQLSAASVASVSPESAEMRA